MRFKLCYISIGTYVAIPSYKRLQSAYSMDYEHLYIFFICYLLLDMLAIAKGWNWLLTRQAIQDNLSFKQENGLSPFGTLKIETKARVWERVETDSWQAKQYKIT